MQDWERFRPGYEELADRKLTAENVSMCLREWSDLEKAVSERQMTLLRAKDEDTRNKDAETVYTAFVQEIMPPSKTIN